MAPLSAEDCAQDSCRGISVQFWFAFFSRICTVKGRNSASEECSTKRTLVETRDHRDPRDHRDRISRAYTSLLASQTRYLLRDFFVIIWCAHAAVLTRSSHNVTVRKLTRHCVRVGWLAAEVLYIYRLQWLASPLMYRTRLPQRSVERWRRRRSCCRRACALLPPWYCNTLY